MPKLTIKRDGNTNFVKLDPSPLNMAVTKDRDADGRLRLEVVGDKSLNDIPAAQQGVRVQLDAVSSGFFEPLAADLNPGAPIAFTVGAGKTVTLTLKSTTKLPSKKERAPGAARFKPVDIEGHLDQDFTWEVELTLTPPRSKGSGHNDVHIEC